jgi:SAM-dependent methyltransferase
VKDSIDVRTLSQIYDTKSEFIYMSSHFYDGILDLMSSFKKFQGLKILDVGCGQGLLVRKLLERFPDNEVYGIDFSRKLVRNAKFSGDNKANVLLGDALRLPFRESSFDAVICSEVIEHVVYPNNLFTSIASCLRENRSALFTLPNVLAFYPLYALFKKLPNNVKKRLPVIRTILIPYEDQSRSIQPIDHTYSSIMLIKWLKRYGFEPLFFKGLQSELPQHVLLAKLKSLVQFHGKVSTLFKYRFLVMTRKVNDS